MKYASKQALTTDISIEYESLCAALESIADDLWEARDAWGDGWSIKDLVAHLAEWQKMLLGWHEAGTRGEAPAMPAPGYKWNETRALNRAIRDRLRGISREAALAELGAGHLRVEELVESLSPEQILDPGHFTWTGRNALATYIAANTAGHYRFALKIIRRWKRRRAL